jgi:hypothetical protein
MNELAEVTMTLTPLVKREHPRWTTNRCKLEATKLAKKFLAEVAEKRKVKVDWGRIEKVNPRWDIISKRLQVS